MTTSNNTDRSILVFKLSELLGFDDGVSDVVEHLLSIESSADLMDYLSQLLGSSSESIQAFVQDVVRYQRGEPLTAVSTVSAVVEPAKLAAAVAVPTTQKVTPLRNAPPAAASMDAKKKNNNQTRLNHAKQQPKNKIEKKNVPVSAIIKQKPAVVAESTSTPDTTADNNDSIYQTTTVVAPIPTKKQLNRTTHPKGQAPYTCGCFGTRHPALVNCLFCGRISCTAEGYHFCSFCGYLVEPPDKTCVSEQAWELKERLLWNQKNAVQQTTVVDDQVDYYKSGDAWLTETEQAASSDKERQRQMALHQRQHMQLNIQ